MDDVLNEPAGAKVTLANLIESIDGNMIKERGFRAEVFVMAVDTFRGLCAAYPAVETQYKKDGTLAARRLVVNEDTEPGAIYGFSESDFTKFGAPKEGEAPNEQQTA